MRILLFGGDWNTSYEVVRARLHADGDEVIVARDLDAARRAVGAHLVVVLHDGGDDAVTLCRALRVLPATIELLFVVSAGDDALAAALLDAAATDVIAWPDEAAMLGRRLQAARRRIALYEGARGMREAQFRAVIECAIDAIYVKDTVGRYVLMNPAGARLFGVPNDGVAGRTDDDLFGAAAAREIRGIDERVLRTGEPHTYEQVRAVGGRETVFLTAKYPYRSSTGELYGIIGISRDITDRKQLQLNAQLLTADRLASLSSLSAGVAHEIKNPLQAIMACSELLRRDLARRGDVESVGLLDYIDEASERISVLASDLTTHARTDEGCDQLVDLGRVIDSAVRLTQHAIKQRARLVRDYDDLPIVRTCGSRLGQVFVNLLANAAQALPDRPAHESEIRVSARVKAGRAVVEVADNGVGIAPEVMPRLFEPFFTTKPAGVGTGIGLYLCRDIVTRCGGEITVESEPGRGALFRVVVPVSVETAAGASACCR